LNSAALNNEYSSVPEPRIGFAYDIAGKHDTVVRAGYGIYSVREDIGAVDNLSFTAPFYPLSGGASTPGSMGSLLAPLVPPLGTVSAAFVPSPSFFEGFEICGTTTPTNDTTQCPAHSGNIDGLFGLAVPLHWIVPTTQQWNLTIQRQVGGNWVFELGYVGTKGTHLRSTFDPDQPALASPTAPVTVTCASNCLPGVAPGTSYQITSNPASNALARAPYQRVNPALLEAFYPNSDSHYNSL
jgi:hypothetical protein